MKEKQTIRVREAATVKEVAQVIDVPVAEAVKALLDLGIMAPAGAQVDETILIALGEAYGIDFEYEEPEEEKVATGRPVFHGKHMEPRPPIVTVMGTWLTHGKTTLLDYIRQTNITAREPGALLSTLELPLVTYEGKEHRFS